MHRITALCLRKLDSSSKQHQTSIIIAEQLLCFGEFTTENIRGRVTIQLCNKQTDG